MNPRIIGGVLCFCAAMSGLFLANMFLTMMIGEINRKRPDGGLFLTSDSLVPKSYASALSTIVPTQTERCSSTRSVRLPYR